MEDFETLEFITEEAARIMLTSENNEHVDKGYIISPDGFQNHLIDTGNISYDVALKILDNHPDLADQIYPDIVRVAGYMHDFAKMREGDKYHEIGSSYIVLTEGERLGLVSGESREIVRKALKEIASITPTDYAIFEELGGDNFPEGVKYPEHIGNFDERLSTVRKELSKTDTPLTIGEFALPSSLHQKIALYSDLTNVEGDIVAVENRLADVIERYSNPTSGYFNPVVADLTNVIRPRLLSVVSEVKDLMDSPQMLATPYSS